MRFLRQLAAAALAVAVVVLLGLTWHHLAPGSLGDGPHGPGPTVAPGTHLPARPPGGVVVRDGRVILGARGPRTRGGPMSLGLGSMLDPVDLPVLRHTVVIEAAVIAAVVIIDVARRRWRRARRARPARTGPGPAGPGPTGPVRTQH